MLHNRSITSLYVKIRQSFHNSSAANNTQLQGSQHQTVHSIIWSGLARPRGLKVYRIEACRKRISLANRLPKSKNSTVQTSSKCSREKASDLGEARSISSTVSRLAETLRLRRTTLQISKPVLNEDRWTPSRPCSIIVEFRLTSISRDKQRKLRVNWNRKGTQYWPLNQ